MAAEVIARELGLDLYTIDLSGVVSKWIGETEKNLDRMFEAAEHGNAMLFFDEADALFGKRSEVSDAHDRYANIEIALPAPEAGDVRGRRQSWRRTCARTSTRRSSAGSRSRSTFRSRRTSSRRAIWERVWPPEMPRDGDIDLDTLATSSG